MSLIVGCCVDGGVACSLFVISSALHKIPHVLVRLTYHFALLVRYHASRH
jgi:hypothetical protein